MTASVRKGAPCGKDETVVRGITSPFWDARRNRASLSAFAKPNTSVSRELITPRLQIEAIFVRKLHDPPRVALLRVMLLKVGRLQELGRSHEEPTRIDVVQKPEPDNPAHAEIIQGLKRSLALKVIREFPAQPLLPETLMLMRP
jgi:hypothetical protein